MGRGVMASEPIREGDEVIFVPGTLIVDKEHLVEGPHVSEHDQAIYATVQGDNGMLMWLMKESAVGEASFWHPYLSMLPEGVNQSRVWSDETLSMLEDPVLAKQLTNKKRQAAAHYAMLTPKLEELVAGTEAEGKMSMDLFLWALSHWDARTINIDGKKHWIPLVDMFNHEAHPEEREADNGAAYKRNHQLTPGRDGNMRVLADRACSAGEELFEDYGDNTNAIYLEYHGFVLDPRTSPPNQHDCVKLELWPSPLPANVTAVARRMKLPLHAKTVCVGSHLRLAHWAEKAINLASMDDETLVMCNAAISSKEKLPEVCTVAAEPEEIAAVVRTAAKRRLSQYSTTEQEDSELLDTVWTTYSHERTAVMLRLHQKMLLGKLIEGPVLSRRVKAFNEWVQNFPTLKLEAREVRELRLGAFATEDIAAEELYLSVPEGAVMDAGVARAHDSLKPLLLELQVKMGSDWDEDFDSLLLLLMYERFVVGESSKWWAYMALLPDMETLAETSPLLFLPQELSWLEGSAVKLQAEDYQSRATKNFQVKWEGSEVLEATFGEGTFTWERYQWATVMLDTRSIWWNGKRHLVPMLDLVNCGEGPAGSRVHSTTWNEGSGTDANGAAETRAAWAFKKGEQVFEDYGQPNHVMFLYHGFTLPGYHRDCLLVHGSPVFSEDLERATANVAKVFPRGIPAMCVSPTQLPPQFLVYVRALSALPVPPPTGDKAGLDRMLMDEAGLTAIKSWAMQRMGAYPRARPGASTPRKASMQAFIQTEQALLQGILERAEELLLELNAASSNAREEEL
ncbi:unnamed protein product [Chrysoparadoxa australica]